MEFEYSHNSPLNQYCNSAQGYQEISRDFRSQKFTKSVYIESFLINFRRETAPPEMDSSFLKRRAFLSPVNDMEPSVTGIG